MPLTMHPLYIVSGATYTCIPSGLHSDTTLTTYCINVYSDHHKQNSKKLLPFLLSQGGNSRHTYALPHGPLVYLLAQHVCRVAIRKRAKCTIVLKQLYYKFMHMTTCTISIFVGSTFCCNSYYFLRLSGVASPLRGLVFCLSVVAYDRQQALYLLLAHVCASGVGVQAPVRRYSGSYNQSV